MSTHVKPAPRPESLLGAWHAHVAATAKHRPWLVREMLRRKQELLPKFAECYRRLRALPRRTRRLLQRRFAPSLAGAALLFALGQGQALAATINVTTNVPDINADGQCSLIEAIVNANNDAATHADCTAGSGADTISLPANSTHMLTTVNNSAYGDTGLPVISSEITIEGNDSTITRDGAAPAFRLLAINSTGNLTLQDTTLSGGVAVEFFVFSYGGGIMNRFGQLRLEGCTVSGNTAGLHGGGVYSGTSATSTMSLVNSTVSGNSAHSGGGVFSRAFDSSTVSLVNSTVSGNSVYASGGGVFSRAYDSSTVSLVNSTVSGNSANYQGGGVFSRAYDSSTVSLVNSTVSGNSAFRGGGMEIYTHGSSTMALRHSLIAGNTATDSGDEVRQNTFGGSFLVDDANLFGHDGVSTADALEGVSAGATDILATSDGTDPTALADILATTLADNGGPTQTHALVIGSPAIDAAGVCGVATDQRGVARPQGVACDIGAFEGTLEFVPEICGNCIDDDGDGKIDLADDDCQPTNPLTVTKGSFTLKSALNKDIVSLKANFPSTGVTINPPADGVAVSFFDADGGIECVAIPPNSAGWKVNKKGTTWSFKDAKDDSLGDPAAEETVVIKRNNTKERYEITVNIKEAELTDPDVGLISSGVVIGDELRVNTQMWESAAKGKKLVTP